MATKDQRNMHTALQIHHQGAHADLCHMQDGKREPDELDGADVPDLWSICVMQQQRIEALERFCRHLQESLSGFNEVLPEAHVERLYVDLMLRPLES